MTTAPHPPETFTRPLALSPCFSPRPWGGDSLRRLFNKNTPPDKGAIGESWELSDHHHGRSAVRLGGDAGEVPFGELLRANPLEMIGRPEAPEKYPLLVKYIDAEGDLSVQVHPDDAWCQANGHPDRGKSECWYVLDCRPGTTVVYGFRAGVTREAAARACRDGTVRDLLVHKEIHPGSFLTIPPGCVHAMLAGTLVCEIQQSSDTTFRLYDWERRPARPLHIHESLQVALFDSRELPNIQRLAEKPGRMTEEPVHSYELLQNQFFQVTAFDVRAGAAGPTGGLLSPTGAILNVVHGNGRLETPAGTTALRRGETFFLPAAMQGETVLASEASGLRLLHTVSLEL